MPADLFPGVIRSVFLRSPFLALFSTQENTSTRLVAHIRPCLLLNVVLLVIHTKEVRLLQ